jgi:aspartate/tyrosine/aromatic aminotransferase
MDNIHRILLSEGPAAVIREYPELASKEAVLNRILDAEELRASFQLQIQDLEQRIDSLMGELQGAGQ